MSFAAKQVRGLLGIAGIAALSWCSAAIAQTTPKEPPVSTQPTPKAQPAPKASESTVPKADSATTAATPAKKPAVATGKPPAAATKATIAPASGPTSEQKAAAPAGDGAEPTKGETGSWVPASSGTTGSPAPGTEGPASPWPEGATPPPANAGANAPPVYYVDRPPTDRPPTAASGQNVDSTRAAADSIRFEIEEPPVPPPHRHTAPRSALWLGARVGYFIPFGDLWGRCAGGYEGCSTVEGSSFGDVAASGPMFELDVGARLGRNYVVYLGWERAQLGSADGPSPDSSIAVNQLRSESDFFALGFRLSADPDDVGLLLDLAIGARRFRAYYEDSTELQLTQAPLESRLGIGVDIRTNRRFSLSPMLTLGIGSFGKADWVNDAYVQNALPSDSDRLTHGWVTLQLGGHFDLLGND